MKATKKQILEHASEMYHKYSDLVWYARTKPENIDIPGVRESIQRIEESYPEDVKNLKEDDSNWFHGFNSGCLASFGLIMEMNYDMEFGLENFPMLDT